MQFQGERFMKIMKWFAAVNIVKTLSVKNNK